MYIKKKIQRRYLLNSLIDCDKTALLVRSYKAELYARVLTPAKGNKGKEIYFQEYFVFTFQGIVTAPLTHQLGRFKETGLTQFWQDITHFLTMIDNMGKTEKADVNRNWLSPLVLLLMEAF